jgi:hypothetical protein
MDEKIIRCPVCGKIVALEKGMRTQKIESVHGICWDKIGYSIGGWGFRRDFVYAFSGEVCEDCFNALKTKINEFKEVFDKRKNSCNEGICIYKTPKNKTDRDNLFNVQQNKLQP